MIVILVVSGFLLLIGLYLFSRHRSGGVNFPWMSFYVKGKHAGFDLTEIKLLGRAAILAKIPHPQSLFFSNKAVDRCMREVILNQRAHNTENDSASVTYLSQLFEIRKRIEAQLPKYHRGITSSRDISTGQFLKLSLLGEGVYTAKVIETLRGYMAITYPEGVALPPGFSWQGQEVRIHFWRAQDAGYYFDTTVRDDHSDQQYAIIHVKHSHKLVRFQKRSNIRVDLNLVAELVRMNSSGLFGDQNAGPDSIYRCKLIDISESGAGVMIGGRAKAGTSVKIKVILSGVKQSIPGIIKQVTYRNAKNFSILHIEFLELSMAVRNSILMQVFGILKDES